MCDNCIPVRNEDKEDIEENCGCGCLGFSDKVDESKDVGIKTSN